MKKEFTFKDFFNSLNNEKDKKIKIKIKTIKSKFEFKKFLIVNSFFAIKFKIFPKIFEQSENRFSWTQHLF